MPGNTCGFRPNYYTIDLQLSRRFFDSKTTVSTWHEEMILLAHTSYLFAQCRIGTYPPFWALGRSPMQEHIDKLEFVDKIKSR